MTSFIQSMRRYALSALTTLGAVVALIAMSESGMAVPLLADVAGSLRAPTPLVEAKVKTQCVIINGLRVCGKPVKTKNKNKHQDDDSGTQQRESSGCAPGLTLVQGFGAPHSLPIEPTPAKVSPGPASNRYARRVTDTPTISTTGLCCAANT
jgi:hypothetical protein